MGELGVQRRDPGNVATLVSGHDALISAVRFQGLRPSALLAGLKQAGGRRLLVVGGAGSLEVPRGGNSWMRGGKSPAS